jgi:hypothetical protein
MNFHLKAIRRPQLWLVCMVPPHHVFRCGSLISSRLVFGTVCLCKLTCISRVCESKEKYFYLSHQLLLLLLLKLPANPWNSHPKWIASSEFKTIKVPNNYVVPNCKLIQPLKYNSANVPNFENIYVNQE